MRFVKRTTVTSDGEIAEKTVYELDCEQIEKESRYDGFYAVVTNLEGDVSEILWINRQRWEIEENFRIMKDELGSRGRKIFCVYGEKSSLIRTRYV